MRAGPQGLARIAALIPGVSASADALFLALRAMIAGDMRLPRGESEDLHPCLLLAAAHPEADEASFEVATALLLADRIAHGAGRDDLYWHWDAFSLHYRAADAQVRTALMQGFALTMELGDLHPNLWPTLDDLTTYDAAEITDGLRAALRSEPREPALPGHIATEPVADDVQAMIQTCLAALTRGEGYSDLAQCWARLGHVITTWPVQRAAPVLAAFRWIYESDPDWDPLRTSLRTQSSIRPIPWATLNA